MRHYHESELLLAENPFPNCLFGDAFHPAVVGRTKRFYENPKKFLTCNALAVEISTLKYYLIDNVPYSIYYSDVGRDAKIKDEELTVFTADYESFKQDILQIRNIVNQLIGAIPIILISHVDLISKQTETRIPQRQLLTEMCLNLESEQIEGVHYIDLWAPLREKGYTFDQVMIDIHHWSPEGSIYVKDTLTSWMQSHFPTELQPQEN